MRQEIYKSHGLELPINLQATVPVEVAEVMAKKQEAGEE
jgi:hypothetical protein